MGFLFVWQFVLSWAPRDRVRIHRVLALSGYIWKGYAATDDARDYDRRPRQPRAALRRINRSRRSRSALWVGTIVTVVAVIATGRCTSTPRSPSDFPPGAFNFSLGFCSASALRPAWALTIPRYYDVCYIGRRSTESRPSDPAVDLISTIAVALIYIAINFSIIRVVPWREFVPVESHPQRTSWSRSSWSGSMAPASPRSSRR